MQVTALLEVEAAVSLYRDLAREYSGAREV